MLADKYLPVFHHQSKHQIAIRSTPAAIASVVDELDVRDSALIRVLFFLRGMPSRARTREGLTSANFIELERVVDREMLIGIIGKFWQPKGGLQAFHPDEFASFDESGFAKAVWHFGIVPQPNSQVMLTTETRIFCTDEKSRRRFSRYWFMIRPFSGLIRNEILRLIKRKAEGCQLTS